MIKKIHSVLFKHWGPNIIFHFRLVERESYVFVSKVFFFSQYIHILDLYIRLNSASILFPGWQEQKENYFISRWLPKEASGSEHKENIRKK